MKINKLKGKITENQLNYEQVAKELGLTITTINKKMNGKTDFKLVEAEKLSNLLHLTDAEKLDIFFG